MTCLETLETLEIPVDFGREFGFVRKRGWNRGYTRAKTTSTYVEARVRIPAQPKKKLFAANFFVSFLSHLIIYIANVWNEKEADNARERRDFEDDEVKRHIRLSSAQPSALLSF